MGEFLDYFKNKKNLAALLILAILILALPLGLTLLRQRQIIKSKATGDPIVFVAASPNVFQNSDGSWVTKIATISMQLTSSLGPPTPPYVVSAPYQASTSLLSDGHNTITQTCPLKSDGSGPNYGACTYTPYDLQTDTHFAGHTYLSISSYSISVNGSTTQLVTNLLESDGHTVLTRTCPVNGGVITSSNSCTFAAPYDYKTNSHFSANTYLSLTVTNIDVNGNTTQLISSFLESDGHTYLITTCPVNNGVASFGACTYSSPADLKTNSHYSANTYSGFDLWSLSSQGNTTQILSNLYESDGHTILNTTCPVSAGVPNYGACTYNPPYDLKTNSHYSANTYLSSGTYTILK